MHFSTLTLNLFIFLMISVISCRDSQQRKASSGNQTDPFVKGGQAETLEGCNAKGLAWIAVVESGQAFSTCGGQLADWGCCEAQLLSRYPSMQSQLSVKLGEKKADGMTLYNCERDPESQRVRLHFAKYETSGRVMYSNLSFTAHMAEPADHVTACPRTPPIPNYPTSLNNQSDSTSGQSAAEQNRALEFTADIQPILTSHCANGGCHANQTGDGKFIVDQLAFFDQRELIRERLCRPADQAGMMPPAGWGDQVDQKHSLLRFIGQLNGVEHPSVACP